MEKDLYSTKASYSIVNVQALEQWITYIVSKFGVRRYEKDGLYLNSRDFWVKVFGRSEKGWERWVRLNILSEIDSYKDEKDYRRTTRTVGGKVELCSVWINAHSLITLLLGMYHTTKNRNTLLNELMRLDSELEQSVNPQSAKNHKQAVEKSITSTQDKVRDLFSVYVKTIPMDYFKYNMDCYTEWYQQRKENYKFFWSTTDLNYQLYKFLQLKEIQSKHIEISEEQLSLLLTEISTGHPIDTDMIVEFDFEEVNKKYKTEVLLKNTLIDEKNS